MRPYPGRYLEQKKVCSVIVFRVLVESLRMPLIILTHRFRVFLRPIAVRVDVDDKIVKASCCLHNLLMRDFSLTHDVNVETSRGMQNISNCPLRRMPTAGTNIRKIFAEFFFPGFRGVSKRLAMFSKIYISFKFNLLIQ